MKKIIFFICFVIVAANLRAQTSSTMLNGILSAPTGTTVVIQNNGKNDLTTTVKKENGKTFTSNKFNFPAPLAKGATYKVTIKKFPAGQTCSIYGGANGTMPSDENKLRIGCDFTYDLVSRNTDGGPYSTFYESSDAAVGGSNGEEGRYIVFLSSAAGIAGSTGKHRQVFLRDRNTGITKLISAAPGGEPGNGDSYAPTISGDGKCVAFESYASNLVTADKNNARDIFTWHVETAIIKKISKAIGGKDADAESFEPSLSGNGNFVAFTSYAGNISTTDKGVSNNNVFLYDALRDTTIMISIDPQTRKGGGGSKPSISWDGSRIAFYSHTNTLVPGDNNGLWDIFLWEKNISKLKRISLTADGKERDQGSESANRIVAPAISGNGRYIAFATTANNMTPEDMNGFQDVYLYDIDTGITTLASKGADGKSGNGDSPIEQGEKIAISYEGTWLAFATKASNLGAPAVNVVMRNTITGKNRAVSTVTGSSVARASISYSGAYVVFGIGSKLDGRFASSGMFANYTGLGPCRSCPE